MEKRYVVEIGMGVDQHGHRGDPTDAAIKAVRNAISNISLCGISEILNLSDPGEMIVDVLLGAPFPQNVDEEQVLEAIPFGSKRLRVVEGGLIGRGVQLKSLGDDSEDILIVNAAITVSFNL
ncbi:MAG: hypothetical protein GTO13_21670 [Proteobacteria bacterium]|nr:hypothetical protein [Pseudomonadota bacterium]